MRENFGHNIMPMWRLGISLMCFAWKMCVCHNFSLTLHKRSEDISLISSLGRSIWALIKITYNTMELVLHRLSLYFVLEVLHRRLYLFHWTTLNSSTWWCQLVSLKIRRPSLHTETRILVSKLVLFHWCHECNRGHDDFPRSPQHNTVKSVNEHQCSLFCAKNTYVRISAQLKTGARILG